MSCSHQNYVLQSVSESIKIIFVFLTHNHLRCRVCDVKLVLSNLICSSSNPKTLILIPLAAGFEPTTSGTPWVRAPHHEDTNAATPLNFNPVMSSVWMWHLSPTPNSIPRDKVNRVYLFLSRWITPSVAWCWLSGSGSGLGSEGPEFKPRQPLN